MSIHKHTHVRLYVQLIHTAQHNAIQYTNISHTQQQKENQLPSFDVPRTGTKKSNHSMLGVENVRTNICVISLFIHTSNLSIYSTSVCLSGQNG